MQEVAGPDLSGRVLGGQFRLVSLLGRGGMGEVYVAEQLGVGRRVAVKVLNQQLVASETLERRFGREAEVLARINHPHIVQLLTFSPNADGLAFLAMEYVEGRTLSRVLADEGALPESQALGVIAQICSALVEAHRIGIVHRDLKPDNIMISERYGQPLFVKVLDFGVARLVHTVDTKITQTGAMLGTPQYMAPEQLREKPADERTDIYALGLIGYELLTGRVPFKGNNTVDLMLRVLSEPPPPLSSSAPGVSPASESLILRCLAKEPSERFQSAQALGAALAELDATARATSTPRAARVSPHPAASSGDSLRPVAVPHDLNTTQPLRSMRSGIIALALFAGAVVLGLTLLIRAITPSSEQSVQVAQELAANQPTVEGIPVLSTAEVVMIVHPYVTLRVPESPERVLEFYRTRMGPVWGGPQDRGATLLFTNPRAPIRSLNVTPFGAGTQLAFARNPLAPAPQRTNLEVHGVRAPPSAVFTLETATSAVFHVPQPLDATIALIRAQFDGQPDASVMLTTVSDRPYLLITIHDGRKRPIKHVAVMATPDAIRPGPGVWSQVSVQP